MPNIEIRPTRTVRCNWMVNNPHGSAHANFAQGYINPGVVPDRDYPGMLWSTSAGQEFALGFDQSFKQGDVGISARLNIRHRERTSGNSVCFLEGSGSVIMPARRTDYFHEEGADFNINGWDHNRLNSIVAGVGSYGVVDTNYVIVIGGWLEINYSAAEVSMTISQSHSNVTNRQAAISATISNGTGSQVSNIVVRVSTNSSLSPEQYISMPIVNNGQTSYTIEGLTPSTTYYYRVQVYAGQWFEAGSIASFTTANDPPEPPTPTSRSSVLSFFSGDL